MSRNKLRDLSKQLHRAYENGIDISDLESFIRADRNNARTHAIRATSSPTMFIEGRQGSSKVVPKVGTTVGAGPLNL